MHKKTDKADKDISLLTIAIKKLEKCKHRGKRNHLKINMWRAAGRTGGSRLMRRAHRWDTAVSITVRASHP